MTFIQNFMKI